MQSARIHDLKVMLMVNALKCRQMLPRAFTAYGRLLDDRWEEFGFHSDRVRGTLLDRYGVRQGESAFDDYETRLGNYHSSVVASVGQCRDIEAFIRLAERANHGELEALSKLVTNRSIESCRSARYTPAPAETAFAPQANEAFAERTVMVDGIPTYTTPGTGPDTRPEPLEVVELPGPGEPVFAQAEAARTDAANPSPAAAQAEQLSQAIAALDAAASALRAMQVGGPKN